jgi:lanosterol synthase
VRVELTWSPQLQSRSGTRDELSERQALQDSSHSLPYGAPRGGSLISISRTLADAWSQELYVEDYDKINWFSHRSNIAPIDLYAPHPMLLEVAFFATGLVERVLPSKIRNYALDNVYKLITMEDEDTSYQCQALVNKTMNMIARWDREGRSSEAYRKHKSRLRDFLWVSPTGMLVCGTNGSQLWDAAFIAQALFETGLATEPSNAASVAKLHEWLDDCQIKDNPKYMEEMCRHPSKGAWPFSTREQGYT